MTWVIENVIIVHLGNMRTQRDLPLALCVQLEITSRERVHPNAKIVRRACTRPRALVIALPARRANIKQRQDLQNATNALLENSW